MHLLMKQLEKPEGLIGSFIGWMMTQKNAERCDFLLEKLEVEPSHKILEVGFGTGNTLARVSDLLDETGELKGIDHSEIMFRKAMEKNEVAIGEKKMNLYNSSLWDFHTPEDYYDIVYASNVHFFWENPVPEFRFMRELLIEGGKLVIVTQPKGNKTEEEVLQIAQHTTEQFMAAGFDNIEVDYKKAKSGTCISVIGYK